VTGRCNDCRDLADLVVLQAERISWLRAALANVAQMADQPTVVDIARSALTEDRTKRVGDEDGR